MSRTSLILAKLIRVVVPSLTGLIFTIGLTTPFVFHPRITVPRENTILLSSRQGEKAFCEKPFSENFLHFSASCAILFSE